MSTIDRLLGGTTEAVDEPTARPHNSRKEG